DVRNFGDGDPRRRLLPAVWADRVRLEACAAVGVHAHAGLLVLDHPAICRRASGRLLRPALLFLAPAVDRLLRGGPRRSFTIDRVLRADRVSPLQDALGGEAL